MSSGASGGEPTLTAADRRIVSYLAAGADYPALIASNTGLHVPLVERRCRRLETLGVIEPASSEVVYRLTARGQRLADSP